MLTTENMNFPMVTLLITIFGYTVYVTLQIGALQQQVLTSTKILDETKTITALLAAENRIQTEKLAEGNTIVRERIAKLEILMERYKHFYEEYKGVSK